MVMGEVRMRQSEQSDTPHGGQSHHSAPSAARPAASCNGCQSSGGYFHQRLLLMHSCSSGFAHIVHGGGVATVCTHAHAMHHRPRQRPRPRLFYKQVMEYGLLAPLSYFPLVGPVTTHAPHSCLRLVSQLICPEVI